MSKSEKKYYFIRSHSREVPYGSRGNPILENKIYLASHNFIP